MRFALLGPLVVVDDEGRSRTPAARRQRRLLLALLVSRGESVSADWLIDVVWPDGELPRDPQATLRTYVTRVRTALEPDRVGGQAQLLSGGPDRYRLDLTGHELDADAFEAELAQAAAMLDASPARALEVLERGLARWQGAALAEVADEPWALPEAVRLTELRATALEHQLRCLIETGRADEAVVELELIVRAEPLRERPHGLLMLALDRCGRSAQAAGVFDAFRQRLASECGLDPSEDLRRLHVRLLSHSEADTFADTRPGRWDRIPVARGVLYGRDDDVAAGWALLADHQVVTVTGVGGVGKTRLAGDLAHRTREAGGRVVFVELGRVTERDGIVDAVFDALGMPAVGRRSGLRGLLRLFRSQRALVVLDDCEHLVDAVAELVGTLVRELPAVTVLATSREPLGVAGEHVYRLRSLEPSGAVDLFVARAAANGVAATFGSDDRERIAEICRRLDGIPLAIEFAAARVSHLTVSEIARRLDERFWLLTGGTQTMARHQTLEAAIAWSYELLSVEEQATLRAAAAFVDGFPLDALATVAGISERAALEVVAELVDKSLVEADTTTEDGARYRLLETVRLFALERLRDAGEVDAARRAHASHYLRRARQLAPHLADLPAGVDRSMCRMRLEPAHGDATADLGNHRSALRWLDRRGRLAEVGELAARIPTVLGFVDFLDPDHRYLAREDVATALEAAPAELALYLTASALNASYLGALADAQRLGGAAMACATDPATRSAAAALTALGDVAMAPDQVPELVDHALRDAPEDARFTRLILRGQRSLSLIMQGRLREGVERLEPHARLGDVFAAAEVLLVLHVLGDDERALEVRAPEQAQPGSAALWAYRWPLARALAHAARGAREDAVSELLEAWRDVAISPMNHEHDILLAVAALEFHAGAPGRALELLYAVRRQVISPASWVLARHYRTLAEEATTASEQAIIRDLAGDLDVRQLLQEEMRRIAVLARLRLRTHRPAGHHG